GLDVEVAADRSRQQRNARVARAGLTDLAVAAPARRQLADLGRLDVAVAADEPELRRDDVRRREALLTEEARLERAAAGRRQVARLARIDRAVPALRHLHRALAARAVAEPGTRGVVRGRRAADPARIALLTGAEE